MRSIDGKLIFLQTLLVLDQFGAVFSISELRNEFWCILQCIFASECNKYYVFPCKIWHFQAHFSYLWVIPAVFCGGVEYSTGPKMFKSCKVTSGVYFDEKIILICYLVPEICASKNQSQTRLMSTITAFGFNKQTWGIPFWLQKCIKNWKKFKNVKCRAWTF